MFDDIRAISFCLVLAWLGLFSSGYILELKLTHSLVMKKIAPLLLLLFSTQGLAASCPDGSEPVKSISVDGSYFEYKCSQYAWLLMARFRQVVQSRKMSLALGLYKQYPYYVAPIAHLQGRLRIFCHQLVT